MWRVRVAVCRLFNEAVEEQRIIRRARGITDDIAGAVEIEIPCGVFEDKAREHNCYELGPFYKSKVFAHHGYTRDELANTIMRAVH